MGLSQLEICNQALLKIGADTIDTLVEPSPSVDGSKSTIELCNIFFDQAYDETLRLYPWNSAKTRTKLTLSELKEYPENIFVSGAGTSGANGTYTYNGIINGRNSWDNGSYTIQYVASTAGNKWYFSGFDLPYYAPAGDGNVPPKTGWIVDEGSDPAPTLNYFSGFGYARFAKLPGNMVRLVDCFAYENQSDERTAWVVEGGYVMSNYETLYLKYIARPVGTEELDPLCTNALITMLAIKLCPALQLDSDWATKLNNELYQVILPQARSIDTLENKELLLEESSWLLARQYDYPII